ncbi:MAG TPA: ABC transporter substrate-binding protein [Candidatus Polarisedimenticolia bacterium]|nr:ABC transporter substrate-binding protein [Candidatus Polarisedimenticolia bacterium]
MTNLPRRHFVAGLLATAAGLLGRDVLAQSPRLVRIGALTESWGPTPSVVGLRDGLRELGYREDKDFTIGVRFTEGKVADLPAAARDLARHRVDVIVTTESGPAAKAAQMATNQIPIVVIGSGDPVGMGLVRSLARPGGNVTGVADLDAQLVPKRMEIFRELVPGLKRLLVPYDATNPDAVAQLAVHREAALRLGLTLVEKPVRSEEEARATITGFRKGDADGMFSLRFLSSNIPGFILELASRGVMPTMFTSAFFVERGGLASYAANLYELGKQAARLVDKILKGASPANLPVEQSTKFELVINLKTARALELTVPQSLLFRADRVIE